MPHFLLTRFNLRIFRHDKHGNEVMTPEWTSRRFELFERYCFPSVANQSVKDFRWICLFDKDTPEEYKERIEGYQKALPGFVPCYLDAQEALDYVGYFQRKVAELSDGGVVITSYLDNDDMLHKDYVKTVQEYAREVSARSVITFDYGLQFFVKEGFATKVKYHTNHFLTMVEKPKEGKLPVTVIGIGHVNLDRYKGLNVISDSEHRGMWIETIHETNVGNDVLLRSWSSYCRVEDSRADYGCELKDTGHGAFLLHIGPMYLRNLVRRGIRRIKGQSAPPYIVNNE